MDKTMHCDRTETTPVSEQELVVGKERKRSKSEDSRGSSISSEVCGGVRRKSRESAITEERTVSQRISKAIEEEDAFLDYIKALPAMSSEKIEAYKKTQSPVYKRSTSEVTGGLEHLDNLYRLMEHLGRLRMQNSKLQERVKYLENIAQEDVAAAQKADQETEPDENKNHSRTKRSTKCKSSHYGIRQTFMKSTRERSRSVGVEEIMKSTARYRVTGAPEFETRGSGVKAKVSKWTKVKEAFRWEKASNGVLPEAKSQDSGLGAGDDVRFLRVPQTISDNSSFSVSPADSVLSGQSLSQPGSSKECLGMPHISSSASTSDEDLEDSSFAVDAGITTPSFRRGCEDPRRSKSLDGESQLISCDLLDSHELGKDQKTTHASHKGTKTPWGKMKDMIQTRTGSIKKKKGDSDIEEDSKSGILSEDINMEESLYEMELPPSGQTAEGDYGGKAYDKSLKRRLAPMLTITLPSTEELHPGAESEAHLATTPAGKVATKPPPSPQTDERHPKPAVRPKVHEEPTNKDTGHYQSPRKISAGSTGTSPPTPRRLSKWSKVKNAFLTSGSASEDCLHRGSSSVPSSPVKSGTFVYDIESDELSSGEFMDDSTRDDDVFPEPPDEVLDLTKNENIHSEIQRNYEELQLKLSQEFHKKLCEWERKKSSGSPGTPPSSSRVAGSGLSSGTSSIGDDSPHDKGFRKKMEEWEKMKGPGGSGTKHRESVTLQQLGEENLSADFKKKLEEWEKIKSVPVPQTPDISNVSQPHFKKKITEWQLWRPGVTTSKSDAGIATPPIELPEDFYRKLQEWERLKQGSSSASHPGDTESPGNKTPSPGPSRHDGAEHKGGKLHSPTSKKEKGTNDFGFQIKIQKSKSHHEVKELAWLEKELHKIEREKQRLERERDKFLEREARLEKLRKAIGANATKQEILIPTSTGLFRFEGISQKFTRKLYEWEKAKGIGPEASTFALLDPGYQPPGSIPDCHRSDGVGNGSLLTRSKSMGSVVDIVALAGNQNPLTHQPSSLSLNHMEQLESNQLSCALAGSDELCGQSYDEEPQAMIVDVEDVIEETASPLEHTLTVECQTPVYCYAPTEVTRLIDSSGSDSDKDVRRLGVQAQTSIELLQENISLLDRLQRKEDICRDLENKIEDVEDKLNTTERIHREHLGNLVEDEVHYSKQLVKEKNLEHIKKKLIELESQQERLLEEGATLQHSFVEHSEQQALIAQDLVGKVKQLQDNITTTTEQEAPEKTEDSIEESNSLVQVHELTSQLLNLAEKLELAVGERNQEISLLRKALGSKTRAPGLQKLRVNQHWFSSDSVSSIGDTEKFVNQGSEELSQLPVLLTNKLHELKECLGSLTPQTDVKIQPEFKTQKTLNIIYPESPEVETTFFFNIGKKKTSASVVTKPSELVPPNETESENNVQTQSPTEIPQKNQESSPTLNYQLSDQLSTHRVEYDSGTLERESTKKKNDALESVVELTFPLKTYFTEDCNEKRTTRRSSNLSTDSDDVEYDNCILKSCKPKDSLEGSESENIKEYTTKKLKRSRRNSGLLERRRSRTNSKNEITDDEEGSSSIFDACTSRKAFKSDNRYKKSSKYKISSKDCDENERRGKSETKEDDVSSNNSYMDCVVETAGASVKSLNSPKCVSRRIKKNSKSPKDSKCLGDDKCLSYKYCCNTESAEAPSCQEMTVNVFVPTTRKIFSPVRKDSKGETSTVISYVVEDPVSTSSPSSIGQSEQDVYTGIKKNSKTETITDSKYDTTNSNDSEINIAQKQEHDKKPEYETGDKVEELKQKYDFIMPPCWILKQARAQSASPALQRRTIQKSWSKEKISNKDQLERNFVDQKEEIKIREDKAEKPCNAECTNCVNDNQLLEAELSSSVNQSNACATDTISQKDNLLKENCRKHSSSSESVENNRPLRKESSIPSSLKLRSEAGFPPISPLTVRREMKVMKETAPSIRLMIAKYNQKVHESQELTGTKSPESGGQSPIAWRSPATERRIKAQMEKYQEEVRKALQNSTRKDFYPNARLGQVQKSASAGYIRPFERGCSTDGINEKSEDNCLSQAPQHHGILKSSSAGAIKPFSPLPQKHNNINYSGDIQLQKDSPSSSTLLCEMESNKDVEPKKSIIQPTSVESPPKSSFMRKITKIEKIKIPHIPPIPTMTNDKNNCMEILELDHSPQSTRIRALKLKRAKEEFLLRGCCESPLNSPSIPNTPVQNDRLSWTESKARLSQISCGSESSYENVPMIVVSGKEAPRDHDGSLLVKSASAGMINIDSATSSRVFCGTSTSPEATDQGAIPKSKSGILSRFRKARLKRNKEKDVQKLDTVSTLCRQSLVVDIHKRTQNGDSLPSSSKSCPSSPVLHKKDHPPAGSWIRNPRRIFKPK